MVLLHGGPNDRSGNLDGMLTGAPDAFLPKQWLAVLTDAGSASGRARWLSVRWGPRRCRLDRDVGECTLEIGERNWSRAASSVAHLAFWSPESTLVVVVLVC